MKKYKVIAAVIVLIILILVFIQCSSIGVSGSATTDGTTGSAVDTSTMPSNSEFMEEQ